MASATNYVNVVVASFASHKKLPVDVRAKTSTWLENKNDVSAEEILDGLNRVIHPGAQSRYRFPDATKEAELNKAIFEIAFKAAPERVIASAEEMTGTTFYPLWQRSVWIRTPQMIGSVLGNPFVKVIASIIVILYAFKTGYKAYDATGHFVGARVLPFVINNTPFQIINIFNASMSLIDKIYNNRIKVILCTFAAKTIILSGPEIPYITPAVREIDLWSIFQALSYTPQSVGSFIYKASYDAATFTWSRFNDMSMFFCDCAQRTNAERLLISKQQAYALWVQSLQNVHREK